MYEPSKEIYESKTGKSSEINTAVREWVESQQEREYDYECSSYDGEESCKSSVFESTDCETDNEDSTIDIKPLGIQTESDDIYDIANALQNALESLNSNTIQTVGNVCIENSTGVHIGNTTNINGNIKIVCKIGTNSKRHRRKDEEKQTSSSQPSKCSPNLDSAETVERVSFEGFIDRSKFKLPKNLCAILPRHAWLAQSPMEEYTYLTEPVPYVIVSHTATESSEKRAINVRIVRDVQCFHIESRGWNDIGYNFLVGCDGNTYEGRGWGVVGAHTLGYNVCSIGVSFIGCFMRELPTKSAFIAFRNLLQKGVEEGHIAKDYKLITHSQCCSTESPGRKLIEELETWDHFYRIEEEDDE